MRDPWLDRLSEYIDGELNDTEALELEAHVGTCDTCRVTLDELRVVIAAAETLHDREPHHDLWAGIAAGIGAASTGAVTPLRPHHTRRRFSFSMAQLAAAAAVIMTLTGGAVWLAVSRTGPQMQTGTIMQSATGAARLVSTEPLTTPEHAADVAALERALEENRAQLDAATIEVLERSLEAIDRAIQDASTALANDPGNPYLHRQLDNTMRKKVDILRRATGVS
jgi:anti-sigma factor RsiW